MKTNHSWTIRFFIIVAIFLLYATPHSLAEELETAPHLPGTIDGSGKHFEITDSEYLNVSLESSENITARIESAPEMIVLNIKASNESNSSQFILSGLLANTTYHKYQDGYHNHVVLIADNDGVVSFEQDTSQDHTIFIQPRKSTKSIHDANGGDCESIGDWNASSKICTLGQDVNETIEVYTDGITLDGNGHTVSGSGTGSGVCVSGQNSIVKNISVTGFYYGIYLFSTKYAKVEGVTTNNNRFGIELDHAKYSSVSNSTAANNESFGLLVYYSLNSTISGSTFGPGNSYGIQQAYTGDYNTYENNDISNNRNTGIITYGGGNYLMLRDNKIIANAYDGVVIGGDHHTLSGNVMSGNGFGGFNGKSNFSIAGGDMSTNNVDQSNVVEGKPIYYSKGENNKIYDSSFSIGSLYCINCNNVTVKDLVLSEHGAKIFLWHTNNSLVENVTSPDKSAKVDAYYSSGNTIKNNDLGRISVQYSSNNNQVYNNNFSDTYIPANLAGSTGNLFNLDLPIGGNYWKKYEATCQDGDNNGFCDDPFAFLNVIDNYPYSKPFNYTPAPSPIGNSNVLFLPGIKASRLYETSSGVENPLWPPELFDNDLPQLGLDNNGQSINTVYTQEVIDEKPFTGENVYKTFMSNLASLKSNGTINNYNLFAYDWRRSVEDVAQGETLYRNETKRALTELENLADSAKNKKVTIIAHSNGGLLAKAIMIELEKAGKTDKVDKIVFVDSPQMGTPSTILTLLYGYDEASPAGILISQKESRTLAENMPGAYGLLPSKEYFTQAGTENPLITFSSENTPYAHFKEVYDGSINSYTKFQQFLTAEGDGRSDPDAADVDAENVLRENILSAATEMHTRLDAWTPPKNVKVIEIAGWGLNTISGIDYTEKEKAQCFSYLGYIVPSCAGTGKYEPVYEPKFTVDGDKVVVEPSMLMLPSVDNVEKYWVDLYNYNDSNSFARSHGSILEVDPLWQFLSNIIESKDYKSSLPDFIKTSRPDDYKDEKPHIRMSLYSPLDIQLEDSDGHKTGPEKTTDGQTVIKEEIPNSYYYQFGERKYVGFPGGEDIHIALRGYDNGSYTLKLEEIKETTSGEEIVAHTTFKNLPVSPETTVALDIPETGLANLSNLEADFDGNGKNDYAVAPIPNGEAVLPDMIAPETSLKLSGTQGQNGWHTENVTVELSVEDNQGGSGVDATSYSLDGGTTWQDYFESVKISAEGITNFQYFSTDMKGNKEDVKTENIKIDKTAPEAKLIFNQIQRKLDVIGVDNLPGNVSVTLEEKIIDQKVENKKGIFSWIFAILDRGKKKKQIIARLIDEAGHSTEVVLEKDELNDHFSNFSPKTITYDGVKAEFSNALLQYKWLFDSRKNRYLLFGTHIRTDAELLEAHYFPKRNETWLMEKPRELDDKDNDDDAERRPSWKKLPGMVVPYFQTNQGKINIAY